MAREHSRGGKSPACLAPDAKGPSTLLRISPRSCRLIRIADSLSGLSFNSRNDLEVTAIDLIGHNEVLPRIRCAIDPTGYSSINILLARYTFKNSDVFTAGNEQGGQIAIEAIPEDQSSSDGNELINHEGSKLNDCAWSCNPIEISYGLGLYSGAHAVRTVDAFSFANRCPHRSKTL